MDKKIRKVKKPTPIVRHTKTSLYRMIKSNPIMLLDDNTRDIRRDLDELGLPNSIVGYNPHTEIPTTNLSRASSVKSLSKSSTQITKKKPNDKIQNKENNRVQQDRLKPPERKYPNYLTNKNKFLSTKVDRQKKFISKTINQTTSRQCNLKETNALDRNKKNMHDSKLGLSNLQQKLGNWLGKQDKSLTSHHNLNRIDLQEMEQSNENKENIEPNPPLRSNSYDELNITYICETQSNENFDLKIANGALKDLHNLILNGYSRHYCELWLKLIRERYNPIENEPEYWECKTAIEHSIRRHPGSKNLKKEETKGDTGNPVTEKCIIIPEVDRIAVSNAALEHTSENEKCNQDIPLDATKNSVESLDELFKKFSLMRINASCSLETETQNEAVKIYKTETDGLQEKNTLDDFQGTIIKFAVKELQDKSTNGEHPPKFVATPVKRSTRSSRSGFVNTPDVTLCSSLKELTPDIRKSVTFKKNLALLN